MSCDPPHAVGIFHPSSFCAIYRFLLSLPAKLAGRVEEPYIARAFQCLCLIRKSPDP